MTQHLTEITRHFDADAHAILIMDQAGWHISNNHIVPETITILPLPPKSPELKPKKYALRSTPPNGNVIFLNAVSDR
jgi:hypothetical protein